MLLDATAPSRPRGKIIDLDTQQEVRAVKWFNTDKGVLERYETDADGKLVSDEHGNLSTEVLKGRFLFVPRDAAVPSINYGAARCARCPSTLTLPGDDLCPPCRARERGQRHNMRVERLENVLLDRKCMGCSRLAEFMVSDEVLVSPILQRAGQLGIWSGKKVTWERGMTVRRRFYCAWCYRPPQIVDARGEVISQVDSKLRPQ